MTKLDVVRGKVWKFGDNLSTTDITPNELVHGTRFKPKDIAFSAIRPDWRDKVKPGDCIVAGKNFGFGSHRAMANDVMRDLGIGCIVADSIARIYYRASIAIGFPAFPCPGVSDMFDEGNEIELDIHRGIVRNLTTGASLQGNRYPEQLLEILDAEGMMPLLVEKVRQMNCIAGV
jgi:3-isopropylmalate/(R)-2-methylmalate dehydratase small subunit